MKQKGHHYITESYQRNFSDENGHVWVLDSKGKIYNTNPENSFKEDHFYTVKFPNGGGSLVVEKTLSQIEGLFINVLKNKIQKQEKLEDLDKAHISLFVAGMITRTKVQREHFRKNYDILVKRMEEMKEAMINKPSNKFHLESTGGPSMSLDELKKYMEDFDSNESIGVINTTEDFAPIIYKMKWSILKTTDENPFLSSNNPLCMCSPEREKIYGKGHFYASAGLGHDDVELTFPISKEFALLASWNNKLDLYVDIPASTVEQINYRTCRSSDSIFSNNRDILDKIVSKSVSL